MTLTLKVYEVAREVEAMLAEGRDEPSLREPLRRVAERFKVRL